MTVYVQDTFTGADNTNLTAHAPDIGSAWTQSESDIYILGNQARTADFQTGHDVTSTSLPTDYTVSCDITLAITGVSAYGGVVGRHTSYGGPYEWYYAAWSDAAQQWELGYFSGSGPTTVDTYPDPTFTSGTHTLALVMNGTSMQLLVDNTLRCVMTNSLWTAGPGGIRYNSGVGGAILFDNFTIESGGAPPGVHPGLTGQGTFSVGSLAALKIDISPVPDSFGTGKGYPIRYFEVGSVAFGIGGFFTRNYYLEHAQEYVIVPISGVDTVSYSFHPLVTATITEVP